MSQQLVEQSERLEVLLRSLSEEYEGLRFVVLATSDGFLVAHAGAEGQSTDMDPNRIATMAVSFTGLSYSLASECEIGEVKGASVESSEGLLLSRLLFTEETDFVLLTGFKRSVNHGIANWTLQKAYDAVFDCLNA
jgi:predicted regulator of Ras-like GTPase activity (Roadblock/LC7/MglB family)